MGSVRRLIKIAGDSSSRQSRQGIGFIAGGQRQQATESIHVHLIYSVLREDTARVGRESDLLGRFESGPVGIGQQHSKALRLEHTGDGLRSGMCAKDQHALRMG